MRIIFTKHKMDERIVRCSKSDGDRKTTLALIGQVSVMLAHDVIFEDGTKGNENKWLVIHADDTTIKEFDSKDAAKEYCRNTFKTEED